MNPLEAITLVEAITLEVLTLDAICDLVYTRSCGLLLPSVCDHQFDEHAGIDVEKVGDLQQMRFGLETAYKLGRGVGRDLDVQRPTGLLGARRITKSPMNAKRPG